MRAIPLQLVASRLEQSSLHHLCPDDRPRIFAYVVVRLPSAEPCGLQMNALGTVRVSRRRRYQPVWQDTDSDSNAGSDVSEQVDDNVYAVELSEEPGAFAVAYSDCHITLVSEWAGVEVYAIYALVLQVRTLQSGGLVWSSGEHCVKAFRHVLASAVGSMPLIW